MVLCVNECQAGCQTVAWEQVNSKSHNLGTKTTQWQTKRAFLLQIRLKETGDWRSWLWDLSQSGFPLMKCPSASQWKLILFQLSLQILSASHLRTKLSSGEIKQAPADRQLTNSVWISFFKKRARLNTQMYSVVSLVNTPSNGLLLCLWKLH